MTKLKKKRWKIGKKIAIATPKATYYCKIYKISKPSFEGRHYNYLIIDEIKEG